MHLSANPEGAHHPSPFSRVGALKFFTKAWAETMTDTALASGVGVKEKKLDRMLLSGDKTPTSPLTKKTVFPDRYIWLKFAP